MDELIKALGQALQEGGLEEGSDNFKKILGSKAFEGLKTKLDNDDPKSFDELLKLPHIKSEFDRRQTQSIKTNEENLRKKFDFKEKGEPGNDPTDISKMFEAKFAEMEEKFNRVEKERKQSEILIAAEKILSEKKIPKVYLKSFNLESETSLEDQAKAIETEWIAERQSLINSGFKGEKLPGGGGSPTVSQEEAQKVMSKM